MAASFETQSHRSRVPVLLLVSVAEHILEDSYEESRQVLECLGSRIGVILYMHTISHKLKKVAQRDNVRVVLSAPIKN